MKYTLIPVFTYPALKNGTGSYPALKNGTGTYSALKNRTGTYPAVKNGLLRKILSRVGYTKDTKDVHRVHFFDNFMSFNHLAFDVLIFLR